MSEKNEVIREYAYEAKNKKSKLVKGFIRASSLANAKTDLKKQGLIVKKIKKKSGNLFGGKGKITSKDLSLFFRQMATMMQSGVAIVQSFDIVIDGITNQAMRELLGKIKDSVESGTGFGESLAKHPDYFDELAVNLIKAGENSGTLDNMLDRVATYKEKTEALKAKVKKAVMYPIAVLIVAFIVTAVLLIYVVPQFEQLFNNFDAELPLFTQLVIQASELVQAYWYLILGGLFACVMAFKLLKKRSRNFNSIVDKLSLRIPIFGRILLKSVWARFARTLATTFAAGVPLLECLGSVKGAVGSVSYGKAIDEIASEVETGQTLHFAMKATELFPSMMVQMVAIGEEAGSLDSMLSKVASFYEEEVDNDVDSLSSLLEPIIIVILGTLVGGLIVAMYLPIFKMGAVVG